MLNENGRKNYTASGNAQAEDLIDSVLSEMADTLQSSGLSVYLGGSYGRGEGGVRQDTENGVLYNDLDFFVFARKVDKKAGVLLQEIAEKYEKLLKVDVDFSKVMSVKEIKRNAKRLMMQELKRGYRLVCGEDLLAEYLPELPAEKLPFSEACRLLLNRGMGLLFAGEKISQKSGDTDFILRNIYKAILGSVDAMLIAQNSYRWKIADRLELIEKSEMLELYKDLYREAVAFKQFPHRKQKPDMKSFWNTVRDLFRAAVVRCAQTNDVHCGILNRCYQSGEVSLANYIKYCIKSRSLPLIAWHYYAMPTVAVLAVNVDIYLSEMPEKIDRHGELYQYWLKFN